MHKRVKFALEWCKRPDKSGGEIDVVWKWIQSNVCLKATTVSVNIKCKFWTIFSNALRWKLVRPQNHPLATSWPFHFALRSLWFPSQKLWVCNNWIGRLLIGWRVIVLMGWWDVCGPKKAGCIVFGLLVFGQIQWVVNFVRNYGPNTPDVVRIPFVNARK